MGFNKRFVHIDGLLFRYKEGGIESIETWLSRADALIVNMLDSSHYIVNKLQQRDYYGAQLILEYELNRQGLS